MAQVTYSRSTPFGAFDRHPILTSLIVLAISIAASWLFLHFTHERQWFFAAVAVSIGALFTGRFLGERLWPALGGSHAALVLRMYASWARRRGARMSITPYADFVPSRARQTWEAMSFASALAVLAGASMLYMIELDSSLLPWLSLGALVLCAALTFVIVPHWVFARLGLRIHEPERHIIRSVAESYASFVRISNGTLLLGAAFYGMNVLMLGRMPRLESGFMVALTVSGVLALSLTLFGTAAAYYRRHEEQLVKRIAAEARRVGFVGVRAPHLRSL